MDTFRTETTVTGDRKVTVADLPFSPGEEVEVIVSRKTRDAEDGERYPLRGEPIRYLRPTESVAEDEWELQP